jgi:hypothetical protein
VSPDLAAHLVTCGACAEVARLAATMRDVRDAACAQAHPPSAGIVWWRAQRKAREDAARKAARPISFVHAIALGCAAAAVVALLGLGLAGVRSSLASFLGPLSWPALPATGALEVAATLPLGLLLAAAGVLLLAPVAIYLAFSE